MRQWLTGRSPRYRYRHSLIVSSCQPSEFSVSRNNENAIIKFENGRNCSLALSCFGRTCFAHPKDIVSATKRDPTGKGSSWKLINTTLLVVDPTQCIKKIAIFNIFFYTSTTAQIEEHRKLSSAAPLLRNPSFTQLLTVMSTVEPHN